MKIVFLDVKTIGEDIDLSAYDELGEVVKYSFSSPEEVPARVTDADVIILNKVPVNEQTIGTAKNLKLVCVTATGTNNLDKEYLDSKGIAWRNVAGYSTETVAQHTFAMLLFLLEKLRYYDDYVKEEHYVNDVSFTHFAEHFTEIHGKTWGIIGLGAIGRRVAEIARAFGAKVIYYSTSGAPAQEGYEQVVYIPMSSALSASCHAAIQLSEEYDGKVQVVDDHRISVTMRESVLEAKWMANQGMTAEEIKKRLEENAYNSSIYIAVDTLEYLKKGGRVTAAGAAIGAVLNIKPVLTIQGEKLDAFTKVRGMKKAELKMLEAIEEDLNTRFADVDRKQLRLGAAGTFQKQEDADQWYKMVKDTFENEIHDIYYDSLSFSIGCHVGPNAIGIGISVVTRDEK